MDNKIIFVKTSKGEKELQASGHLLSGDIRRALVMIDGVETFGEILKHAAPSLRAKLPDLMTELQTQGYIQDKSKVPMMPKLTEPKRVISGGLKHPSSGGDLDFTSVFQPPTPEILAAEAAKAAQQAATAQSSVDAGALAQQVRQQVEREAAGRVQAELETAKKQLELEAQARAMAEESARRAAELRAAQEAELLRLKARQVQLNEAQAAEKAALEAAQRAKEAMERQVHDDRIARELAERQAKVLLDRQTKELAERQAREAEMRRAKELAEQQARQEREARELAEQQAKALAAKALAERQAKELAERQAQELATKELLMRQAKELAEQRAKELAAKALAERQAKELAEQRAKELAAKELAERQAKELAELHARELAAAVLAQKQAKELAEQQAREAEVRRAKELAEQQAQQERQARALVEQQAKELLEKQRKMQSETQTKMPSLVETLTHTGLHKPLQEEADGHFKAERADTSARTTTATVLFFDMVAYSKQSVSRQTSLKKLFNQLVSFCLRSLDEQDPELIILDTGDGAAIGFMLHPEDALEVAMHFRRMVSTESEYGELHVRMGIHLGPINVMVDMNGKPNMVGSGINDAQRVMDFAGSGEIFISRSYFDFVSRLSEEYEELFRYRGIRKDKHGYEHPVYELLDPFESSAAPLLPSDEGAVKMLLEPALLENLPVGTKTTAIVQPEMILDEIPTLNLEMSDVAEVSPPPVEMPLVAAPAVSESEQLLIEAQAQKVALIEEIAEKRRIAAEEAEAKKLADSQAKAWKHAERRALEAAKVNAERAVQQEVSANASPKVIKPQQPIKQVAPPPPPKPNANWLMRGAIASALLLLVLFVVPMLLPMDSYEKDIEQLLTDKLHQPVSIGKVELRLLPTPQFTMQDLIIGKDSLIRVQRATAAFALLRMFESHKTITQLKLEGVRTAITGVETLAHWMDILPTDEHYTVRKVVLSSSALEADNYGLNDIRGELHFDNTGHFVNGDLSAMNGGLTLSLATQNGHRTFDAFVRTGVFPLIPRWAFDEAHFKGNFTEDGAVVQQLTGRTLGGFLNGKMQLAWNNGWLVDGDVDLSQVDAQKITHLLTGGVKFNGHFKLHAAQIWSLKNSFALTGQFVVSEGQFKGTDMTRVLRSRGTDRSPGGRTSFNDLSGNVACAALSCQFKQLKLHHGALNAMGDISMDSQQKLSGILRAGGSMQDAATGIAFYINGSQDQPEIVVQ